MYEEMVEDKSWRKYLMNLEQRKIFLYHSKTRQNVEDLLFDFYYLSLFDF